MKRDHTDSASFGLPPQRIDVGSAVNQAIRQMGSVFGVALVVVLLGNAVATALLSSPIQHAPGSRGR